jgi:hypothetical protein
MPANYGAVAGAAAALIAGTKTVGAPPGNGSTTATPDVGTIVVLSPWEDFLAYRAIYLDDDPSPGLCVECYGSNPVKWDKKDGTGISGATVTFNGEGLAEFPARIQLGWEGRGLPSREEQWARWQEWSSKHLRPPSSKNQDALRIWYPTLDLLPVPITAVIVAGNGPQGPKQVADGVFEWSIPFLQFRRPKAATATPKGAKGGAGGGQKKDLIDQMIDDLVKDVNRLA